MRWLIVIVLTGNLLTVSVKGHSQERNVSSILERFFYRISNSRDDAERLKLNDSVLSVIDSYSRSDSVLSHRFNSIRNLGQIASPDRKVKIITWNLNKSDGTSNYYCYFIRNEGRGEQNRVDKLICKNSPETIGTDKTYSGSDWYGALYYDIRPFKIGKQTYYILLGIDYHNLLLTRKIIEVLTFTRDGQIIFGKNCFTDGSKGRYRVVLEYSSAGVVSLRFVSDKLIVFDHLVPFSAENKNNREFYGAEYSNDAYIFKNGIWKFVQDYKTGNKKKVP